MGFTHTSIAALAVTAFFVAAVPNAQGASAIARVDPAAAAITLASAELKQEAQSEVLGIQSRSTTNLPAQPDGGFRMGAWQLNGPELTLDPERGRLPPAERDAFDAASVEEYRRRWGPIAAYVKSRLIADLGPAWRINEGVGVSYWIHGPQNNARSSEALLRTAVTAHSEQFNESARAARLPTGTERAQAEEKAQAAADRAKEALDELRVESHIIGLKHAVGEDVANALKMALPWATFAQVGGTQVVASGTRRELEAATKLAQDLDRSAAEQMELEAVRMQSRNRDTPAGRILTAPLSIDFNGGKLNEFLSLLGKTASAESWVIEDPRVSSAYIPPIKLTGVTANSALMMLDGITFPTADQAQPTNAALVITRIDAGPGNQESPPIYRIGATFAGSNTAQVAKAPPQTITEIFDAALPVHNVEAPEEDLERNQKEHEALLAAIETGVGMLGASPQFKVKLHAPTGILFVSGTPEEIALVRNIVQQWQSAR